MFGFLHQSNRDTMPVISPPSVSYSTSSTELPGILVSKEDIYRENKGMAPILLLRKGLEVSMEELPRFIRNGARPQQFEFKPAEQEFADEPGNNLTNYALSHQLRALHRQAFLEELNETPYPPESGDPRHKKQVLVLEPDQKSLKRLVDCLFICGTPLDKIHSIRLPEQLGWAIDKYQPELLVIDYAFCMSGQGLQQLAGLAAGTSFAAIVFTLAQGIVLSPESTQKIQNACPAQTVRFLEKPVSRFTVYRLLADT
jgi:hypothetical protein